VLLCRHGRRVREAAIRERTVPARDALSSEPHCCQPELTRGRSRPEPELSACDPYRQMGPRDCRRALGRPRRPSRRLAQPHRTATLSRRAALHCTKCRPVPLPRQRNQGRRRRPTWGRGQVWLRDPRDRRAPRLPTTHRMRYASMPADYQIPAGADRLMSTLSLCTTKTEPCHRPRPQAPLKSESPDTAMAAKRLARSARL
jgi:hypothetical protein